MAKLVYTAIGPIPFDELVVKDIITDTDNSRDIATEYWHPSNKQEPVRRDVAVSILMPLSIGATQGAFGG